VEVNGNVALVTGAASGLGEATARRLHAHGAAIVLADLAEERGQAIVKELGANTMFVKTDVTSEESVRAAVVAGAELGRLSMSVHCAGGGIAARTVGRDGTPHALDAFRRTVELNLIGTFNVLRLVAAQMATNEPDAGAERGVCVQTASIAGYEGQIGQIAYGSAKAGVIGMTIIAARDLAAIGVRVCTIAPGTIGTPPMMMAPEQIREGLAATVPHPKRLGEPDEYAKLAQSIIENGYLNGEVIRLDGAVRFQPK
jgi:NAD(P)-dependent dehydrogenase (short-subunit alcohol dehydrogenase family)